MSYDQLKQYVYITRKTSIFQREFFNSENVYLKNTFYKNDYFKSIRKDVLFLSHVLKSTSVHFTSH